MHINGVCLHGGEGGGYTCVVYAERFGNQIYNTCTPRARANSCPMWGWESRIHYFQLVKHPLTHAVVQVMLLLKTNKGELI